ncbi:hypothetical protein ACFZ8E_19605 [Methylobacterium sp. HMF5984]|uniref:hypothetical protein n=1 Tax=Methylobacterium sp. HMF5984 TaxID=3367370 RepID=UPI0038532F8C
MTQLKDDFTVEVFDLDQFFMRSTDTRVSKIADKSIKDFCEKAETFDFINIQLEHGTLGVKRHDIVRRFTMIAKAAPALSVTFHTILPSESFDRKEFFRRVKSFRFQAALNLRKEYTKAHFMNVKIYGLLRRLSATKPVNVIVHTRRDARQMKYIHRIPNVYDHPLSYIDQDTSNRIRREAHLSEFIDTKIISEGAKIIGVFGFLSEYKGFDTVVRAMHLLPKNYHLLFFGGLHPQTIKKGEKINAYIRQLLNEANVDTSIFDRLKVGQISINLTNEMIPSLLDHPNNLVERIHFLGAQTDEDFLRGMAVCDQIVLPYLEVGQSASGPMSMAIEMGARIIAARNLSFMQFAKYHPKSIEMFEIGNHVELAERIKSQSRYPHDKRPMAYNSSSNIKTYIDANTRVAKM